MLREVLMILFVTCSTLGSQLLIKHAVTALGARNLAADGPFFGFWRSDLHGVPPCTVRGPFGVTLSG